MIQNENEESHYTFYFSFFLKTNGPTNTFQKAPMALSPSLFSSSFMFSSAPPAPPNLLWFFKATEGKGNKRTTASHRIRVMNAITTIMNPSWALLWTWHWSHQPWGSRRWGFWKSTTKINNESGKCAGMWWLGCQRHSTHTTELKRRDDMGCQRLLMEA